MQLMKRIPNKKRKDLYPDSFRYWSHYVAVVVFLPILLPTYTDSNLASDPYYWICRGQFVMEGYHILRCSALRGTTIADRCWDERHRLRK